jgi:tol-pal system protein YbgF
MRVVCVRNDDLPEVATSSMKDCGLRANVLMAVAIVAMGMVITTTTVMAQAPVSNPGKLEARIDQLERTMSGSSLVQMHQSMQTLAREVRELRGEVEEQTHSIEQLKRRQRDMFLDLDKRLQVIESAGVAPAVAATPPSPSPLPPGPAPSAGSEEQAVPPSPPPGSVASVDPAEEQKEYRAAFELLKGGKFTEASVALKTFLGKYPNGSFADNAQYWLGESYYVSREFGPALKAFEQLLVDYPDSPKRPHSMLKIGFIHDETGQQEQARKVLGELTKQYPQSTAASLASKRLKRLQ